MSGDIDFLRFNNDGSTEKRRFKYDVDASLNTKENPVLMDGDVINVRRTLLGTSTEVLKEVGSPILSGYAIYNIFN